MVTTPIEEQNDPWGGFVKAQSEKAKLGDFDKLELIRMEDGSLGHVGGGSKLTLIGIF